MAYKIVNDDSLTSVANAIRVQGSISGTLEFPDGFVSAIQNLSPSPTLQSKSVAFTPAQTIQTSSVTADSGYDGLDEVDVTVNAIPSQYKDTTDATATADKILQGYTAYANGQKLVGTASGGITPSGTIQITQNGTVDVTQYASADVNVSGGGGASRLDLLATKSLGAISTSSSTEAFIVGSSIGFYFDDVGDYEALISIVSADTKVANHHYATYGEIRLCRDKDATRQKNTHMTIPLNTNYWVKESDMSLVSYANTTAYGIYPKSAASSSGSDFNIYFYSKYNGTRTKTIDGTYTARIYGLKVLDLI